MSTSLLAQKAERLSPLLWLIGGSSLLLFVCSSLRHWLFQSGTYDLGIYDQVIYLISQGQPPISSILGFHILGDHASLIFYPIALFYKIHPDVHWLFALQAIGLSLGTLPLYALARQAGLTSAQALTLAAVYLLYPIIFNLNLFDFHPDVFAPATLLAAVWAARTNRIGWFVVMIVVTLCLKDVLSLVVAAMGVWLLVFEKKRWCGAIALAAGTAWFLIATQWILPFYSGTEARALDRYAEFGKTPLEIAVNLVLKPQLLLSRLLTLANLQYVALLLLPVIWGLSPRHLAPLVSALPILVMNLVTQYDAQKTLVNQYSLPILPFLLLAVIATLADGGGWFKGKRANQIILVWSMVAFLWLAEYRYFGSRYLKFAETGQANREAIAQIQTQGGVITDDNLVAHVSQRPTVYAARPGSVARQLADCEYVLLNLGQPWRDRHERIQKVFQHVKRSPDFQISYQKDEVYLFHRRG